MLDATDSLYFDTFGGSGASAGRPFTVRKQKIPMTKDQQFPLFSSIVQLLGLVGCAIVLVLELFIGHQNHLVASAAADPSDAYFLLLLRIRKGISRQPPKCIHVVAFLLALHGTTAAGKPTAKLAKVATTARCRSLQSSLGCKKPFFSFSSRESSENGENLNSLWYAYSLLSFLSLIQFPHFPWDLWSRF